jgi:alkylation response protein AidB-like acyl-CoA dehydrogenase
MHTPGITFRPLVNAAGFKGFNQMFFDNVRIPRTALLGDENAGWKMAMANLDFERGSIRMAASCQRRLERTVADLRERDPDRTNRVLWHRVAQIALEIEVSRIFTYRVASMESAGIIPNYEASVGKAFSSEMNQRLARISTEVLGLRGQVHPEGTGWQPASEYVFTISATIESGTSEIQRNIIATRGLGLPRG